MDRQVLDETLVELKEIQLRIEKHKTEDCTLEQERLLKMIDAEIMDALHNLDQLIKIS